MLDVDSDSKKALLLSKYGLNAKLYNETYVSVTWEECTLRTWLNEKFLNKAFTAQEQAEILMTNVDNSSSQGYYEWSTSGENNTQDKIFLLSYAKANKYLSVTYGNRNNTKSRIAPTTYAVKKGAGTSSVSKTEEGKAAGWWWLRSPASFSYLPRACTPPAPSTTPKSTSIMSLSAPLYGSIWNLISSDLKTVQATLVSLGNRARD